jgi:hypothetical protein
MAMPADIIIMANTNSFVVIIIQSTHLFIKPPQKKNYQTDYDNTVKITPPTNVIGTTVGHGNITTGPMKYKTLPTHFQSTPFNISIYISLSLDG